MKLRFTTSRGTLSAEQLWDLSQSQLKAAIEAQYEVIKSNSGDGLDFLGESKVDPVEELRFNILKDVFLSKEHSAEEAAKAAEKKLKNQQIMEIIARKQNEALEGKSIEELTKMLED